MPLPNNRATIACAGSGKTTAIVDDALRLSSKRILITTYTNENLDEVNQIFVQRHGCVPPNVQVVSWYAFLLHDGVWPYQNYLLPRQGARRVRSIDYFTQRPKYLRKGTYLNKSDDLYRDKVAEFVRDCNRASGGRVIRRLERMYDALFIDELQDLAGADLDVLDDLFESAIKVTIVGDPRQATFSTNRSMRNRGYRRSKIYRWIKEKEKAGKIVVSESNESLRCNQAICDFADSLFPDFPKTVSKNKVITGHDGVFSLTKAEVREYVARYSPAILRYNKRTETDGFAATNIGQCKGRNFDRVLVFPTSKMVEFYHTRDPSQAGDTARLYVAVTRARFSVAFALF